MNQSDWQRLQEVYTSGLILGKEDRKRLLASDFPNEEELAEEVKALWENNDNNVFDFDALPEMAMRAFLADGFGDGEVDPAFEITETIAVGGMATVYKARQLKPIQRTVALKVVPMEHGSNEYVSRFKTEQQALSLMAHRNIAVVYDAGVTAQGRPFFSMEYLPALPITTYCDNHRLTIEERLALVLDVSDGIQHAHQKGVIHRDIHPGNILVDVQEGRPVPKIIDFGIAKLADQSKLTETVKTRIGTVMGTPGYMSPEQAAGKKDEAIDTRTDVYSLGVLLYELLVGVTPLNTDMEEATSLQGLCRIIEKGKPRRPGKRIADDCLNLKEIAACRGATVSGLGKQIDSDLDWVTMKAIAKDPSERYQSCSQFRDDIQRYLKGLPVTAGPPGYLYPLKKFVLRHQIPVGVGALLVLLFVVAFSITAALLVRTREAERKTEKTVAQLTAANDFVVDMFEKIDPYQDGGHVTGIELLKRASGQIEKSYGNQPEVEASIRMVLGRSLQRLGFPGLARDHLQEVYRIRQALLGEADLATLESLRRLAFVDVDLGNYDGAETAYRYCLALFRSHYGENDEKTLRTASGLAVVLGKKGASKEARTLFEQTLRAQAQTLGSEHPETVATRNNYANLLNDLSLYSEAEKLHRLNLEIRKKEAGEDGPGTLRSMHNLALALQGQKKYKKAEALGRDVLKRRRNVLGEDHPDTIMTLNNLANTRGAQDDPGEAVILLRGILTSMDESKKEHPTVLLAMHSLGHFLMVNKEYKEAEQVLLQTLLAREKVLGVENKSSLVTKCTLAENLQEMNELEKAEKLFREVVQTSEKVSSRVRQALYKALLGSCLTKRHKFTEAKAFLEASHRSMLEEGSSWASTVEAYLKDLRTEQNKAYH